MRMGTIRPNLETYAAATSGLAVRSWPTREQVLVTGPERAEFLHGMVTQDVKGLAVGASAYAAMLTAKGAMVGDGRVLALADLLVVDVEPGRGESTRAFLEAHLISEDAEIKLARAGTAWSLVGPEAEAFFAAHALTHPAWVRLTPLIPGAVDVFVPEAAAGSLEPLVASRPVIDDATWTVLRVEAGVPRFGDDMGETTIPLEANLERAIHFNKGCYIGQEVIVRATSRGQLQKKLHGLLLGEGDAAAGDELFLEGKKVGWVTTVVDSPRARQRCALGYVHRSAHAVGTALSFSNGQRATVAALPFA